MNNTSAKCFSLLVACGVYVATYAMESCTESFNESQKQKLQQIIKTKEQFAEEMKKAIRYGNKDKVEELLKQGFDLNEKSSSYLLPLHLAIWCNKVDIVQLLLENNANPNLQAIRHPHKDTALTTIVRKIVEFPKYTCLYEGKEELNTASSHYFSILELLLQHGGDTTKTNGDCQSVFDILQAAYQPYLDELKTILKKYESLRTIDDYFRRLIQHLDQHATRKSLPSLVEKEYSPLGKQIESKQQDLAEELKKAIDNEDCKKVKELLAQGAELNDEEFYNVLATCSNERIANLLLGDDPNCQELNNCYEDKQATYATRDFLERERDR